jgi:hypothetical protein
MGPDPESSRVAFLRQKQNRDQGFLKCFRTFFARTNPTAEPRNQAVLTLHDRGDARGSLYRTKHPRLGPTEP